MPDGSRTRARSGFTDTINSWMDQRNADVARLAAGAHTLGQQLWQEGNRVGRYVTASRPSDVAALGVQAMRSLASDVNAGRKAVAQAADRVQQGFKAAQPGIGRVASNVRDETLAGLNGAQDALTFGLGDRAYAATRAIVDAANGANLAQSYSRHYSGTQALDAYDEAHHPIARGVGEVAGTAAQIGLLGAGEGGVAALRGLSQARRISQASGLIAREGLALGAGGAGLGLGGQAVGDLARGKPSSPQDYAGAAVGGVAGVGATILGRGRASIGGAADGAVTSIVQDLFNGRPVSLDRAREAAAAGATIGALTGGAGRGASNNLSRAAKGRLGEDLSEVRTRIRGDAPLPAERVDLDRGGHTIPDHMTGLGDPVEAKFGNYARLSLRQRQAYDQPLANYRVDHFLPRDIGALFGVPAYSVGLGLYDPANDSAW